MFVDKDHLCIRYSAQGPHAATLEKSFFPALPKKTTAKMLSKQLELVLFAHMDHH